MSEPPPSGEVLVTIGDRPAREPDATCEGCGTVGTVGRAARHVSGSVVETHRYCARCWPEWSAFYRARWTDESRRAALAWQERPREVTDLPAPPSQGMSFVSATWHGTIDLVRELVVRARDYREPPSAEVLARVAAEIRASAPEKEGPMPIEVRAFLAEFGGPSGAGPSAG